MQRRDGRSARSSRTNRGRRRAAPQGVCAPRRSPPAKAPPAVRRQGPPRRRPPWRCQRHRPQPPGRRRQSPYGGRPSSRPARGTGRPGGRGRGPSARRRRPARASRRRRNPAAAVGNPSRRSPRWPPAHRRRAPHRQGRGQSCVLHAAAPPRRFRPIRSDNLADVRRVSVQMDRTSTPAVQAFGDRPICQKSISSRVASPKMRSRPGSRAGPPRRANRSSSWAIAAAAVS